MEYQVKLEIFEGPLDLLLHLIHKNEVDIFDIPIATITDQYLEYLEMMKALNISVAADFLVMASTLIHIKSKMLLPDYSEEDEEDPRVEITRPLLEYMHLKSAAQDLAEMEILARDVFTRPGDISLRKQLEEEGPELEANIFLLISAFKRIVEEEGLDSRLRIEPPRWSVKEKTAYLLAELRAKRMLYFRDVFKNQSNLSEFIVTFLALLELVRAGLVSISQPTEESDIRLRARFDEEEAEEHE
ncbi:MAG: segregation/condensation protein A [Deltaproteobacteria bacterium]|nr:segregation/condensation protein A [Deltaproteobacteria bacterium]MBW1930869.1 segregation/condensation protein A [Deltaproteobacteria bacterium]MBW2026352.1 segregation/condensation protein A [Deltaproteobacteria bacterium]MBW2125502.1 segregation/condensation protein A [Deltaproteobacteria bacterium]